MSTTATTIKTPARSVYVAISLFRYTNFRSGQGECKDIDVRGGYIYTACVHIWIQNSPAASHTFKNIYTTTEYLNRSGYQEKTSAIKTQPYQATLMDHHFWIIFFSFFPPF